HAAHPAAAEDQFRDLQAGAAKGSVTHRSSPPEKMRALSYAKQCKRCRAAAFIATARGMRGCGRRRSAERVVAQADQIPDRQGEQAALSMQLHVSEKNHLGFLRAYRAVHGIVRCKRQRYVRKREYIARPGKSDGFAM